jgi:hypothetical protein
MMLRSLAVAALVVAGSGVACAQSVYLYVAPGASVYVTPTPNGPYYNGAPALYQGAYAGAYAPPAAIVAPPYGPAEVAPQVYVAPAPAYDPALQAYGAAPAGTVMQRRVYVDEIPRPPAPVPYGRRAVR